LFFGGLLLGLCPSSIDQATIRPSLGATKGCSFLPSLLMKVVTLPTTRQVPYARLFWQNGLSFESPLPNTFTLLPPPPAAPAIPAATTTVASTSAEMMEIDVRFTLISLWATRLPGPELRSKTIPGRPWRTPTARKTGT
jgi:hypothetical protein